jgi:hypothetical protein
VYVDYCWAGIRTFNKLFPDITALLKAPNRGSQKTPNTQFFWYITHCPQTHFRTSNNTGSSVKPGSSWRFEISRTGVSPIQKCLKNRAVVFIKESQVCPNTKIDLRLPRLGAISDSWALHVYTTEMICGSVEKAGFGGHSTQVTSLGINCDPVHCWRSPDWRLIESVAQSGTKKILQIPRHRTVTNPFLTKSRSKVGHQSFTKTF